MKKASVAIIEKDKIIIDKILSILELFSDIGKVKYSNDIFDLELLLAKRVPTIVLVGPGFKLKDLEKLLVKYTSALNHVRVILIADSVSAELLRSAINLNMHDVIEYPVSDKALRESFKRAFNIYTSLEVPDQGTQRSCRKIMFFSTKGGAGNTFLAINFAVALKLKSKKEVTLYDLNYQFGDVALMLNIFPKNTIFDLMTINKYDEENMGVFLIKHNSDLKILPAPTDPTQGEAIKVETSTKVFEVLEKINDYLIIDSPFGFNDEVLAFLENIDHIFIVATKDVPSVKNLKICLQLLERLSYPRNKVHIVLNRADSKVDIEIEEIEKTIQRKIDIKIPSDRMAPVSINKGMPAVTGAPRSLVAKSIYKMLDFFYLKEKEQAEQQENVNY
jgi:pilus assembly protein CpaE